LILTALICSTSLIYPQTVTLYQVDDNIYALQDLATTNLFNTFLDALDGVSSFLARTILLDSRDHADNY